MTFNQNFAKISKFIGEENTNRVNEVLNIYGIESIGELESTLETRTYIDYDYDLGDDYTKIHIVGDDEPLKENETYYLTVHPANDEIIEVCFYCPDEIDVKVIKDKKEHYWAKNLDRQSVSYEVAYINYSCEEKRIVLSRYPTRDFPEIALYSGNNWCFIALDETYIEDYKARVGHEDKTLPVLAIDETIIEFFKSNEKFLCVLDDKDFEMIYEIMKKTIHDFINNINSNSLEETKKIRVLKN